MGYWEHPDWFERLGLDPTQARAQRLARLLAILREYSQRVAHGDMVNALPRINQVATTLYEEYGPGQWDDIPPNLWLFKVCALYHKTSRLQENLDRMRTCNVKRLSKML